MANIKPFKGLRYNHNKVGDMATVTIPPYDIISKEEQQEFYDRSPYNAIRLELTKELPEDNDKDNKYSRAATTLEDWIDNDILVRDKEDSLYIYQQEFDVEGMGRYTRTGFIGLVELVEFNKGIVLPHENTLSKPKADRLNLMRHCDANFSQVFGLYNDTEASVSELIENYIANNKPDVVIENGIICDIEKLWAVSDPDFISAVGLSLKEKQIYIADGHHRYETGLAYRDEQRAKNPNYAGDELYNYVMMTLVAMEDPGLLILPTHRMLKGINFEVDTLIEKLGEDFNIEKVSINNFKASEKVATIRKTLQDEGLHTFIFYDPSKDYIYNLTLKSLDSMNKMHPDRHESYIDLDVSILHSLILDNILGIGAKELASQKYLEYTHSIEEVVAKVDEGIQEMAFFVSATTMDQIQSVSLANEKMPQKSTYFYPKLLTGLVFNLLS